VRAPSPKALVRRPQRIVLVVVALTPYHGLLRIVPHPLIAQGWKEALMVLALLAAFVAPRAARGRTDRPVPRWVVPFGAFVVVSVMWAIARHNVAALYGLKIYFFSSILAIAVWRCPFDTGERDRFVSIVMANGAITGAYGIAQQAIGPSALNDLGYPYNTVIRTTGDLLRSFSSFDGPFAFAFFEMAVLAICVPVALADRGRWRNRAFLVALPLVVGGMLATFVRGAWIAAAVGLTVVVLRQLRPRALLSLAFVAAVAAFAAVLLVPRSVVERATQADTARDRVSIVHVNVDSVLDRPFGHGIGTTGATAEKLNELGLGQGDPYQPDNHYFLVAYEVGVQGLICFVAFLAIAFWEVQRAAKRLSGADGALAAGIAALLAAAIAASFFESYFSVFPNDVLLWVGIATICDAATGVAVSRPKHMASRSRASPRAGAQRLLTRRR